MSAATTLLLLVALLSGAAPATASAPPAHPIRAGNWVWYYQAVGTASSAKFHGARGVVVSAQRDEATAAATIHAAGALAFHYLNAYWLPVGRSYEGIDIGNHPDWQFCDTTGTPEGRTTTSASGKVTVWRYVDLNERGMHDALLAYIQQLKADGYDGVFFDLGTVALAAGPMPAQVSTCTEDPVTPGATFADAYAQLMKDAKGLGMRIVLNYGVSQPLRDDLRPVVDRILRESAPTSDASTFAALAARRSREEADSEGGPPRYIEELKTTRLNDRTTAFFAWAEAALWRIDLTINAGDDGCVGAAQGAVCWHYGTFPELTAVQRGRTKDPQPWKTKCRRGDAIHCLWVRRWQKAIVVVNASRTVRRLTVTSGYRRCRIYTNVWTARLLNGGRCTKSVTMWVPALSGRVLTEAQSTS